MTLPRKGSRTVVVDGPTYRWRVSPQRGRVHDPIVTLYAHLDSSAGRSTLEVQVWERHASVITPGIAVSLIQSAIARGWKPLMPGAYKIGPDDAVNMLGGVPK